jgi:hypothetical protein
MYIYIYGESKLNFRTQRKITELLTVDNN